MKALARSALLFVAVGVVLYAGLYAAAEALVYRTGDTNPFYKLATRPARTYDWVVLGASHAMPLDFADFNAFMEARTGLRILNLATPGTGPLYNRFVLERFLRANRAEGLLYVLDSFGFYSPQWNEERFADAKLLRRTPFSPATAGALLRYVAAEGVDPRAWLDYVTGFSKINNRERFQPDQWEGEAQFERSHRPSRNADRRRIDYLYPEPDGEAAAHLERYLAEFAALIDRARAEGMRVAVIKTPVPERFRELLPGEAAFDRRIEALLAERGLALHDFSAAVEDPRLYFDTDHLNREGLTQFFEAHLRPLLAGEGAGGDALDGDGPRAPGPP